MTTLGANVRRRLPVHSCGLEFVCYNADTFRNSKVSKGLRVTQLRLFSCLRLICLVTVMAGLGLPASSNAATTVRKTATKKATTTTSAAAAVKKTQATAKRITRRRPTGAVTTAAVKARELRDAQQPR